MTPGRGVYAREIQVPGTILCAGGLGQGAARGAAKHGGAPIDPEWSEVQQLKSVAMPLLFQLREDQKREVRSLAHIIGPGAVASLI